MTHRGTFTPPFPRISFLKIRKEKKKLKDHPKNTQMRLTKKTQNYPDRYKKNSLSISVKPL